MATSLFGSSSAEEMQQALINQRAEAFGQQTNEQRLGSLAYRGGAGLGQALGGMFGVDVSDPSVRRASQRQEMMKGLDANDPTALLQMAQKMSQMGDFPAAQELAAKAQAVQTGAATLGKAQADLAKTTLSNAQEAELWGKLQALPQDATEADIIAVVSRHGKPEAIMQALQRSSDKQEAATAKVAAAKVAAEAAMARLKEQGASREEMQRQALASQAAIAQAGRDSKEFMAGLVASAKADAQGAKPMAAGAQKSEDVDLAAIDNYAAQQRALATPIANLSPNAKGVRKLELGPIKNAMYQAQNASGNSSPESNMYSNLKSAVDTAVNLQVSAEKGVQTDSDVKRFSAALIAAYGRNDTKATLEALQLFQTALGTAADKTRTRIQSRRKSQKLDAYVFEPSNALGTPENPIKLD